MKLHDDSLSTRHAVTGYGDHHVSVDGRELRRSLLLLPDHLDLDWGPDDFAALAHAHLEPLATLRCDVLLLGTGNRQRFPSPALLRPLIEAGRNIEVMDTQAACRTYNILMTEGRVVAAALIIEISSAP
ncbi:MAG: MTH938/NDUFAF3 family protein [Rhodocyclaceae bacterium]|nr:MTH938/NDUFAF3 family protein [Rhodocyclaceae bacterium]